MKRVQILHDFEGYPDGDDKPPRMYTAGQKLDVPDAFADLIVDKGHAVAAPDASKPAAPAPVPTPVSVTRENAA